MLWSLRRFSLMGSESSQQATNRRVTSSASTSALSSELSGGFSRAMVTSRSSGAMCRSTSGFINRRDYKKLPVQEEDDDEYSGGTFQSTNHATSNGANSAVHTLEEEYAHDEFDEDYWDDEDVTCNVCDRAFASPKALERHQQKRRHWGCNACEALFDSLMLLEHHKEEYEHWSDDELSEEEEEVEEDFQDDEDDEYQGTLDQEEDRMWREARKKKEQQRFSRRMEKEFEETEFGPDEAKEDEAMLL